MHDGSAIYQSCKLAAIAIADCHKSRTVVVLKAIVLKAIVLKVVVLVVVELKVTLLKVLELLVVLVVISY